MKENDFKIFFPGAHLYLLDGGMGSLLQNKGLLPGKPPETMTLESPLIVEEIHCKYIEAGADIIETNTFGGNRAALARYGLEDQIENINSIGTELALKAAASHVKVAGSLGPTGHLLAPLGDLDQDQAEEIFFEQCQIMKNAGLELVNIETMNDLRELKAAVLAAKSCNLQVMAEATTMENGYTLSGASPEVIIATLEGLGVLAGGLNCGFGPSELKPLLTRMSKVTSLPLVIQPNAGLPQVVGEDTVYSLSEQNFAEQMREIIQDAHPSIVGGCCGTNPEYTKALRKIIDSIPNLPFPQTGGVKTLIAGRGREVWWTGNWDEHLFLNVKAFNGKTMCLNETTIDLFSLTELVKKEKVEIIRLDFDAWEDRSSEVKEFIQELQLYFTGPLSVKGKNPEVLSGFFRYYLGKPLYEKTDAQIPVEIQKCIDKYLPGTVIC